MRRRRYASLLVWLVWLLSAHAAAASTPAPGSRSATPIWPRALFDLRNDSYNPDEATISPSTVGSLATASVSRLSSDAFNDAGPVVVGNRIFIGTRDGVAAYNATTGHRIWELPLGTMSTTTGIALGDGLLYVTNIDQHAIYALDPDTGAVVWRDATPAGTNGPTVVGNVLLCDDIQLRAVDAHTGAPLWSAPVTSRGYAAVSDGVLYLADDANGMSPRLTS